LSLHRCCGLSSRLRLRLSLGLGCFSNLGSKILSH
jgi:hypothetical protein